MNHAHIIGVTVRDMIPDMTIATLTVTANSRNKRKRYTGPTSHFLVEPAMFDPFFTAQEDVRCQMPCFKTGFKPGIKAVLING
jgi:hypothetical protein